MITVYLRKNNRVVFDIDAETLDNLDLEEVLWIDMVGSDIAEQRAIEDFMEIHLLSTQQAEEIESSSRFAETEKAVYANCTFIMHDSIDMLHDVVSFIVVDGILISKRFLAHKTFIEAHKKLQFNSGKFPSGFHLLILLLEIRIDFDADLLEALAKDIAKLNKSVSISTHVNEDILLETARLQNNTMLVRETIVERQRLISSLLRSSRVSMELNPKITIMIKDITSLINHADFSFERLEYLQNTFLGLVNIEQNKIIKIFTVVSVIFMPPTLIASIYGMNFKFMPELENYLGYPFALTIMILSSIGTLYVFKRNKWL